MYLSTAAMQEAPEALASPEKPVTQEALVMALFNPSYDLAFLSDHWVTSSFMCEACDSFKIRGLLSIS